MGGLKAHTIAYAETDTTEMRGAHISMEVLWKVRQFIAFFSFFLFEMAAMPFLCNLILVVLGNLLRIFPMSSLVYASFRISY